MNDRSPAPDVRVLLGSTDIYIIDQIQKGRFDDCRTVLDAGCGSGRNLPWFLQQNLEVHAVDHNPSMLASVKELSSRYATPLDETRVRNAAIAALPYPDRFFDLVICSAVLHFAEDTAHYERMLDELWRVLAPNGIFFARLASDIGIEDRVQNRGSGRYFLPDGSERFLVNESMILDGTKLRGGRLLDPIKTTNVQGQRCMTTWVAEFRE